jgi:hypothetical protein
MKPSQQKSVHFIFKTHGIHDATTLGKNVRRAETLIFEGFRGQPKEIRNEPNRKIQTLLRFFKSAKKAGKSYVVGETLDTIEEKKTLKALDNEEETRENRLMQLLKMPQIPLTAILEAGRQYFIATATKDIFRHKLIRRTIKRSQKPAVVEYGTLHSLLSGELQREGIPSSRDMPSQVFTPAVVVIRKLITRKNPSDLDYKRGIVDLMLSLPKLRENYTQYREEALVSSVLIRNLSENQLDEILQTRNAQLILTFNGLPVNATLEQIKQFVKKHSSFWKRERILRRQRNKSKKKQVQK